MDQKILDFLKNHRVCSLTTILPDCSPHAAAMHFFHQNEPLRIYIQTENTSRKCQAISLTKWTKASIAVGFSEEEWITLQMDGKIKFLEKEQLPTIHMIHYAKHPDAKKYRDEPETVFLVFIPKWLRYTDYNTKPPTMILHETISI